jgi:hypothetical protein
LVETCAQVRLGLAIAEDVDLEALGEGHAANRRQLDDLVRRLVLGVLPTIRIGVCLYEDRILEHLGHDQVADAHAQRRREPLEVIAGRLLGA